MSLMLEAGNFTCFVSNEIASPGNLPNPKPALSKEISV
jgi:hypothetical protein